MKKLHCILILISLLFCACHTNIVDETGSQTSPLASLHGTLSTESNNSYEGCEITTISDESTIKNGNFDLVTNVNSCVQSFIVSRDNKILLMARMPCLSNSNIQINEETTALALVLMHPLFSPVTSEDYNKCVEIVKNCTSYNNLVKEVKKVVDAQQNIYDENNTDLLSAFSNLLEEICGDAYDDENIYDGELEFIPSNVSSTRAVYENPKIYPLYSDITGNRLTLQTTGLTPSYYGTVRCADGSVKNYVVPSRSDFGGMDLILNRTTKGEKSTFDFYTEGEYRFSLSRTNTEATLDFYMRIAGSILSTLGLDVADGNVTIEISRSIANAITSAGSGVSDGKMEPMDWIGIAYGAATDYLSRETSHLANNNMWNHIRKFGSLAGSTFNWYNKIKGAANFAARLSYALTCPEELNFCLCYYDGKVSTCSEASLTKVSGDEQKGYSQQKLLLPLKVYVTTLGDDGLYSAPSSYHRVKFEVISGGGHVAENLVTANEDRTASTEWKLGKEGEQKVKVSVVDVITNKEISEPIYFTAKIIEADVTIRLDWSRHSGNTDIDLHVVDPNGERIFFENMSSLSGGYLDRDDRVGPGPEHIHWDNAPAGTYKIYVHYYPNEDEDKSVVSYKVSVVANGKKYRPAVGSIAYNQMIPIGQFTIGESDNATSRSRLFNLEKTSIIKKVNIPRKR